MARFTVSLVLTYQIEADSTVPLNVLRNAHRVADNHAIGAMLHHECLDIREAGQGSVSCVYLDETHSPKKGKGKDQGDRAGR